MPANYATARERVQALLDRGSFREIDRLVTCHLDKTASCQDAAGWGTIDGRPAYVLSRDCALSGGPPCAAKAGRLLDLATKNGAPLIELYGSGGKTPPEAGQTELQPGAGVFLRRTLASGVIPQISAIVGSCVGQAAWGAALADFVFMVRGQAHLALTGPPAVGTTLDEWGGAMVHSVKSGVCHVAAQDEDDCLQLIRQLLSYLPSNWRQPAPYLPTRDDPSRADEELDTLVPEAPNKPYDVKHVIRRVVDDGRLFEIHKHFAPNIVVGLARLGGHSVGVVANQPAVLAGVLDIHASIKAARFVRMCDAFNIPLITFEDVPGFLPGVEQEHNGIIMHGAKLLHAYCEATVPKLTVVMRKAYGGAYIVMSSKHIRGDINLAWPGAEIAVMGPEGAVNVIFRKEVQAAANSPARRAELIQVYRDKLATPYVAARRGYLDDVIEPHETRPRLIEALGALQTKRSANPPRKHENIPL